MASIIAMAADEIRMPSNTWLMIHNPWSMTMGDKEELRKMADILEKMEGHAIQAYRLHSKLKENEIANLMNAETWMDGKEAVEKGFAEVLLDEVQIAASVNNTSKLKAPAAAMAWVKADATEIPASDPEKKPEEADKSTGGTDNGTDTTKTDAASEGNQTPSVETKPEDGTAKPPENKTPEAAATVSPEIMAKIDAAYDEGEAVGYAKAMKEAGIDTLKSQIQAREDENKLLKEQISGFETRLNKLGSGLNASSSSAEIAPASWEEALKKYDYADARKKFPALYAEYRDNQRKSRK
jgi:hypothetical protein